MLTGRPNPQQAPANAPPSGALAVLLRQVERQRRIVQQSGAIPRCCVSLLTRITQASFELEDLCITAQELELARAPSTQPRRLRPLQVLRFRNHMAILRAIERSTERQEPIGPAAVLRWYTSISCGLSIAPVDEPRTARLERVLRRINSPNLRIQQAVPDACELHVCLMADPVFPGFNGLVSRLLLQYSLLRCGLTMVALDPARDCLRLRDPAALAPRLLELVLQSWDGLRPEPKSRPVR